MAKEKQLYGTWRSPISVGLLASGLKFGDVQWDGETLIWQESRGGRGVLVAQTGVDAPRDLTDETQSVRGRVGYGGGEFTVAGGHVYFAGEGGRLYKQALEHGSAKAVTPPFGSASAPRLSPDGRWIVYVYHVENIDGLALIDSDGDGWPRKLIQDTDFAMQPTWSPDSRKIAYIAWSHPNMPWDGVELRVLTLSDSLEVSGCETLAGDAKTAILQPEFSPDGRYIAYTSDATGWGQLYVHDFETGRARQITNAPAEHGAPAWVQGIRVYSWLPDSSGLVYTRSEQGFGSLWFYHIGRDEHRRLSGQEHGYTHFAQIAVSASGRVAAIASGSQIPTRIISLSVEAPAAPRVHRRAAYEQVAPDYYALPQAITWTGHDGEAAYGLYYPPTHAKIEGSGAPPLIVEVHGGPTSQRTTAFSAEVQFFTSRGYAVLLPNHRGSTGYGRDYMLKLRGAWGLYDVEDSATGAAYLAKQGQADQSRLVIKGGSAGGYTVLQSLVDKPGFYAAGINLFGVSNQFGLALETHKFEARYSDSLLGPLPAATDLYRARSPLFHADKIVDPVIVFQGEDDVVVPRNQSDAIVSSLKARGIAHEYHLYAGEGHGFRKPETLEHYMKSALGFIERYVLFG